MGKGSWTTSPGAGESREPVTLHPSQPLFAGRRPGTHPGMPGSALQLCRETCREQKAANKEQSLLQLSSREGFTERNYCRTAQEELRGWRAMEKGLWHCWWALGLCCAETHKVLMALIAIKTRTPSAPTASTPPHSHTDLPHSGPCPSVGQGSPSSPQQDPYL